MGAGASVKPSTENAARRADPSVEVCRPMLLVTDESFSRNLGLSPKYKKIRLLIMSGFLVWTAALSFAGSVLRPLPTSRVRGLCMDASELMQAESAGELSSVALPQVASEALPPQVATEAPAVFEALPSPSEFSIADSLSAIVEATSPYIERDALPIVAVSVLLPIGSFLAYMFIDAIVALFQLVKGGGTSPSAETFAAMSEDELIATFDEELSAWPAILAIQKELSEMPPAEQRQTKLETGTNWPPRTTTTRPFEIERDGFMFFQGPTPKTSVQEDLPAFLSADERQTIQVPTILKQLGGVFGVSFLILALSLVLDVSIELPTLALPSVDLSGITLSPPDMPTAPAP